ncbi:MAG: NADH-dependent dehydrogenase [Candidatus Carbobacillus altaicus]|uniref:NADH-dependent dehydrogenase n=1 Tax=Candidatus Carbonibacillus altaicus TaxID=2163959 RepID=A0A2R6Y3V7_9BACL|nr:MAG: NADH-dependent dehydrogenase [Candidatus Carbobacillus altaicus]
MERVRVGFATFAHVHAPAYARALKEDLFTVADLVGIYDDDSARGRKAAETFGGAFYTDYAALLADVDVVIVTAENARHTPFVLSAAERKKHILVEKPIATTVADAEAMIAAAKRHGVVLFTAFPVRYSPAIRRLKAFIEAGEIGRVLAIKSTNRGQNPGGWFNDPRLSGGGAVMDHTVHLVDVMRWILKAEVKDVYAEIGYTVIEGQKVDDRGILTVEWTNGVFASIDCSWSRNAKYPTWGDVTLEVIGTDGVVWVDAFHQKLNVFTNADGYRYHDFGDDINVALLDDFLRHVRTGEGDVYISGEDGLAALRVALWAYEAERKGRKVAVGER